jgi:hypothetical protein
VELVGAVEAVAELTVVLAELVLALVLVLEEDLSAELVRAVSVAVVLVAAEPVAAAVVAVEVLAAWVAPTPRTPTIRAVAVPAPSVVPPSRRRVKREPRARPASRVSVESFRGLMSALGRGEGAAWSSIKQPPAVRSLRRTCGLPEPRRARRGG